MKRTAAFAAILAASILPLSAASADGYRMHRHPSVWTGHHRHHATRHHDWRWRAGIAGVRAGYYGAGYYGPSQYGAEYDRDYGYAPVSAYGYSSYAAYAGCGGCAPVYPSCYSYACGSAFPCGYGGGCGGFLGYSRCGGC